jgi:hypothetical protein
MSGSGRVVDILDLNILDLNILDLNILDLDILDFDILDFDKTCIPSAHELFAQAKTNVQLL